MKKIKKKLAAGGIAIALFLAIIIACFTGSWLIVCGIIKLITMCFGLTFKWSVATGIWLILLLLKLVFGKSEED